MSEKTTNKNFHLRNLNSKSTDIPNAIPKRQVGERRKITAYLRKRASDEECMKNVKFTPNPNAS